MTVTITGATGFIGMALVERLLRDGHTCRVLARQRRNLPEEVELFEWHSEREEPPRASLEGADALINLAGETVSQRWNEKARQRIRDSRVKGTRHLVQALTTMSVRPPVLVSASAIGIYGDRGDEVLTEESPLGEGFLADVCREWEQQAELADSLGIRVVRLRLGVVLGKQGGALAQMLPAFRGGAGAKLGSGKQWMSWIHLDDAVELILFAIGQNALQGAVNATAPQPVRNEDFTATLGHTLHRPAGLRLPAFAVKLIFGEMGQVALGSQRVLPQAAERAGFVFAFPGLPDALGHLLSE